MIRNPWWDGVWIWSVFLIGPVLAFTYPSPKQILWGFLIFNTGHLISPIAMAWSHRGYRQVMLRDKGFFVFRPAAVVLIGVMVGLLEMVMGTHLSINPITLGLKTPDISFYWHPIVIMAIVYFVWNTYHYVMQNYGIVCLYWSNVNRVKVVLWAAFITMFGMLIIPDKIHEPHLYAIMFGTIILGHQLSAIGIASHVWGNHRGRSPWWFAGAVLLFGAVMTWPIIYGHEVLAMVTVGIRFAMGFNHFAYDGRVNKFSNPQVRATIGRDLFAHV